MAAHRLDRLSALVTRFAVAVTVDPVHAANLAIHPAHAPSDVSHVVFVPDGGAAEDAPGGMPPAFRARVEWGGPTNPLVTALPGRIEVAARPGDGIAAVATLIVDEARERRCGSGAVLDRLGEVLLVRLLRERLDAGTAEVGLLAGLADPRIAPAIVAMHNRPGHGWRAESLAELAGLSTSRFSARFAERVGTTPMSYLRRWRMVLARRTSSAGIACSAWRRATATRPARRSDERSGACTGTGRSRSAAGATRSPSAPSTARRTPGQGVRTDWARAGLGRLDRSPHRAPRRWIPPRSRCSRSPCCR